MGKNKATKQKKSDRSYRIPMDYVSALAENIASIRPTVETITNSLADFYAVAYARGYMRRISDASLFKEKKNARFEQAWKEELTAIDDLIHPKKESINQNKK